MVLSFASVDEILKCDHSYESYWYFPVVQIIMLYKVVLTFESVDVGEQGWRSGRVLAFHQCGPGSIPGLGVISGLSLLVLYSAPRGFSPGTPVFPSPQKLTFDLI